MMIVMNVEATPAQVEAVVDADRRPTVSSRSC